MRSLKLAKFYKEVRTMTYREKLMLEHPEKVNVKYGGGCSGCPRDYGYTDKLEGCCDLLRHQCLKVSRCVKCWDREIPNKEVESNE